MYNKANNILEDIAVLLYKLCHFAFKDKPPEIKMELKYWECELQ